MKNKRMLTGVLAFAMCCALIMNTSASNVGVLQANSVGSENAGSVSVGSGTDLLTDKAVKRDNMNVTPVAVQAASDEEEDCGSVIVSVAPKADGASEIDCDILFEGQARGTSKPTKYWNIAKDGIYHGAFNSVAGTIYTNYYFDYVKDNTAEDRYSYWTRVDVSTHQYQDTRTFEVRNYCTECGLVSSTKEYTTPGDGESTGYIYIKHYFTSKHDGHFMYPAVVCTNSYGQIDGTIDVNYYNSWS